MALPACAEVTTFGGTNDLLGWANESLSNFSAATNVVTFNGLPAQICSGGTSGGCSSIVQNLVTFIGFLGTPLDSNSSLVILSDAPVPDGLGGFTNYHNYGGLGPDGTPAANAMILRSQDSNYLGERIGFHIVLPTPVTAFGVQIMSYDSGKSVAVSIDGTPISGATGPYPTGTVTTGGIPNRTFFGLTSTVAFNTVDLISTPGNGQYIVIDNFTFGTAKVDVIPDPPPPTGGDTPEPQTAVYMLTGIGTILLARKMKV